MKITECFGEYYVNSVNMSADETMMAVVFSTRTELYDMRTKQLMDTVRFRAHSVAIRDDKQWMALQGPYTTKLYQIPERKIVKMLRTGSNDTTGIFYKNSYIYSVFFLESDDEKTTRWLMGELPDYMPTRLTRIIQLDLTTYKRKELYRTDAVLQQMFINGNELYLSFHGVDEQGFSVNRLCQLFLDEPKKPAIIHTPPSLLMANMVWSSATGLAYSICENPENKTEGILFSYDLQNKTRQEICSVGSCRWLKFLSAKGRYLYIAQLNTMRMIDLLDHYRSETLPFAFLFAIHPCEHESYVSVHAENGILFHIEDGEPEMLPEERDT